jgi:molybdenum cofactor cytidylyltransferase
MMTGVDAVLLAAGESTRMGELKALLDWQGAPLLVYQVEQLLASPIERVAVVLGHRADELRALLPPDSRVVAADNPHYQSGKVSSILAGLAALPPSGHVLVLSVDQPRPAALLTQTVRKHLARGAALTIAGYQGRRGHPIVFAPPLRAELEQIDEETQGLRAVVQRHAPDVYVCETDSPLALANLNTPQDYQRALALVE